MLKSGHYMSAIDKTEIPVDSALTGLSAILDSRKMASILSDRMAISDCIPGDCALLYIRYKPATNCIAAYRCKLRRKEGTDDILFYAKVFAEGDYETAAQKALVHRWTEIPGLEPTLILPELSTIIYFYPNDCVIEGLRVLSDPRKIQRILYGHLDNYPRRDWHISEKKIGFNVIRYKPERRVVLKCDAKATNRKSRSREKVTLYFRIYGDDRGSDIFSVQGKIYDLASQSGTLSVPRPLGYLPERKALIMEMAPGTLLLENRAGENSESDIARTAEALAALHSFDVAGLAAKSTVDLLAEAEATNKMLESVLPSLREQIGQVFDLLRRALPESGDSRTVHGDFYYGQVLSHEGRIAILDFDRSHRGDTVYDLGNFNAHLRLLNMRGELDNAGDLENCFLKSYQKTRKFDSDSLRFWTAFGLFQLTVGPFRRLEPYWKKKTAEILRECERILKS